MLADPLRLEQMFVNLIENAAKYSRDGAAIRIVVEPAEGGARVTVIDEGIGIAADALPRLFDRFYQVERARAQKRTGVGLGLYITKALVEAHGGRITVESEPGRGSRLPRVAPRGTRAEQLGRGSDATPRRERTAEEDPVGRRRRRPSRDV